jgi:tetratricopeptide (TPR) repeat protein
MAQVLAAIWGASYGQMLNDLDRHVESLSIAADSRRLIKGALADLCENGGPETVATVESQKKILLPVMLRQEAWSLLLDGQRARALERLFQALKIDLFWPLANTRAFADYYNNAHVHDVAGRTDNFYRWVAEQYDEPPEWVKDVEEMAPRYERRALADVPMPNLPLFVGWIEFSFHSGANIEKRVERWFSELEKTYPKNPFVLVYWGDALKVLAGSRERWHAKPSLAKVDAAIAKYEAAYKLDPSLSVLAVRLYTLYAVTAFPFLGTTEENRPLKKGKYWVAKAQPFHEEFMHSRMLRDASQEEQNDLMRWVGNELTPGTLPRAHVLRRLFDSS